MNQQLHSDRGRAFGRMTTGETMYPGNIQAAQAAHPAAETPLGGEITNLETYLNDLGMAADRLHSRLEQSVLRPEASVQSIGAASSDKEDPRPVQCQTGERIGALTRRVRNITSQLQNALDRLEA